MYFPSNNSIFPTHWFQILLSVFDLNETKIIEQLTSQLNSLANENLYTLSSLQLKKIIKYNDMILFQKKDIKIKALRPPGLLYLKKS